jgi:hypothetical protein
MSKFSGDDPVRPPMTPRQVLRLLAPTFLASAVLCVVGIVLVVNHHRTLGIALLLVGAGVGMIVRMRLMMRAQRR